MSHLHTHEKKGNGCIGQKKTIELQKLGTLYQVRRSRATNVGRIVPRLGERNTTAAVNDRYSNRVNTHQRALL